MLQTAIPIANVQTLINPAATASYSDEDLFTQMKLQGDYRPFEILFHRYYSLLCNIAYGLTHCQHQSDEIVSDVFLKIWKNREQLNIETKVRYYLQVAVRNKCIDFLRKQIRERNYKNVIDRDYRSDYVMPDDQIIGDEFSKKAEAAIESLPPQGKYIFRLSRNEGMKYREIAEMLDISIKTVETHMRRSLIHLRSCLLQN